MKNIDKFRLFKSSSLKTKQLDEVSVKVLKM